MDEQLSAALKQQLRDVHLPDAVSWWPLAYGWWISLTLALLGITALVYYLLRKHKQEAYRHSAIKELNTVYTLWQQQRDVAAYLQSANSILKRSVLHFTKQQGVASQSGEAWLNTLASCATCELSAEFKNAFGSQVYRANADADIKRIHQELCDWLTTHKTKLGLDVNESNPSSQIDNSELKDYKPQRCEASDA
ncbi:MAG: hypothetical protein ACI9LY_000325 [Arenicella sp.]|jgi:hypothetical protein